MASAILYTRRALDSFTVDYARCLFCGICVEVCPFGALSWSPAIEPPAQAQLDLVRQLADPRRG